jgi:hypothetical protein
LNTLEDAVGRIETALAGLGEALRRRDALAIDTEVQALQGAISSAMHRLTAATRQPGGVPLPSLARANASLQRALDVLLPPQDALAYAADGARARPASSGAVGA